MHFFLDLRRHILLTLVLFYAERCIHWLWGQQGQDELFSILSICPSAVYDHYKGLDILYFLSLISREQNERQEKSETVQQNKRKMRRQEISRGGKWRDEGGRRGPDLDTHQMTSYILDLLSEAVTWWQGSDKKWTSHTHTHMKKELSEGHQTACSHSPLKSED